LVGFIDDLLDGAGGEPLGTGDGNDNPKRRRQRCLGLAAEMEIKGFRKRRFSCIPFVPLAGGSGLASGRTCTLSDPTHPRPKF
jgi:hypothetical protein